MAALTKRIIDSAQAREQEYFIWCSRTPGFGCRIYPSRKKVFVVQVRAGPRRGTQRHKIGEYGPFTVEQARGRAEAIVRAVRDGRNPRQEKTDANALRALTVSALCDKYMEAARAGLVKTRFGRAKRSSTITFDQGRIDRHIKPILGKLAAHEVTARDVQAMVDEIALGKTAGVFKGKPRGKAVVTGGAGTAARIAGLLGGIYTWAKRRGLVDSPNPAHGILRLIDVPKQRLGKVAESDSCVRHDSGWLPHRG